MATVPDAATPPARVDGRTARAERTRQAVLDAHARLIAEGDLRPTGERIAERAGVSLRALWTHFKDMEALFEASGAAVLARQDEEHAPVPTDLPLAERVDRFCTQRARLLELVGPSARASRVREPFSPALRRYRGVHLQRVRDELTTLFAAELGPQRPQREQVVHALTASCTFSSWAVLRDDLGLDVEEARGVMARTVTALLVAAISSG
ncbi:TetR/AcrR family transcriptional regulator [Thalassiella azotivora]